MKAEPWGEALDEILDSEPGLAPVLVVPSPSGARFDQSIAAALSAEDWLVFACGRYEGIDQRVIDHYAARGRVREVSLADVVLNGGEVAAMAIIEAVVRLLPGFLGNPESLTEESHLTGSGGGLLEYPVYTKPASWRGLEVPDVLLSGHHGQIESWRREQAVRRTVERRPDLVAATSVGTDEVRLAVPADAGEILTLRRPAGWLSSVASCTPSARRSRTYAAGSAGGP